MVKCLLCLFAAQVVLSVVLPALANVQFPYGGQFCSRIDSGRDWTTDSAASYFSPPLTLNSSVPGCFQGFRTHEGEIV